MLDVQVRKLFHARSVLVNQVGKEARLEMTERCIRNKVPWSSPRHELLLVLDVEAPLSQFSFILRPRTSNRFAVVSIPRSTREAP